MSKKTDDDFGHVHVSMPDLNVNEVPIGLPPDKEGIALTVCLVEPKGVCDKLRALWENIYLESFWFALCIVSMYFASWVSIIVFVASITLIIFDSFQSATTTHFGSEEHRAEITKSLTLAKNGSYGLLGFIFLCSLGKLYVGYTISVAANIVDTYRVEDYLSWGLYLDTCETIKSCSVTSESTFDWAYSFTFEMSALAIMLLNLAYTFKILQWRQPGSPTPSFIGASFFINQNGVLKLILTIFLLTEIFLVPNLLELPTMIAIAVYIVFLLIPFHKIQLEQVADDNFVLEQKECLCCRCRVIRWSIKDSNLLQVIFQVQQFFLLLQYFEIVFVQIPQVNEESQRRHDGLEPKHYLCRMMLLIFGWIGSLEFQTSYSDSNSDHTVNFHIINTLIVIYLVVIQKKSWSYKLHRRVAQAEAEKLKSPLDTPKASTVTLETGKVKMAEKAQGALQMVLGYDNADDMKRDFFDFLPLPLLWLFRGMCLVQAYMYSSHIGLIYLVIIILSFLMQPHHFYCISVYLVCPLTLLNYLMVYMHNVEAFGGEGEGPNSIFHKPYFNEFDAKFRNPSWELAFLYANLIVVFLSIPAKIRLDRYMSNSTGKDIIQKFFDQKIMDDKSLLWGFVFVIMMNLHTLVLFMLVFIGNNANFTIFNVLSMFFFVVYSAFDTIYRKTSILLPIFVGTFIVLQYWFALEYCIPADQRDNLPADRVYKDFWFLKNQWMQVNDDCDFYWRRSPNVNMWVMFVLMSSLYGINISFYNLTQNSKKTECVDLEFKNRYPQGYKWSKRVYNFLLLISIFLMLAFMAVAMLSQKPAVINLIYVALFLITFGAILTAVDTSSYIHCIRLAQCIKVYSAIVLSIIVGFHLVTFVRKDSEIKTRLETDNDFREVCEMIGLPTTTEVDETDIHAQTTSQLMLRYIVYMIVGQFLHKVYQEKFAMQQSRDLFDWRRIYKNPETIKDAFEKVRFHESYAVYKLLPVWPLIDFLCLFAHLVSSSIIVYFGTAMDINIFLGLQFCLIIILYSYAAGKLSRDIKKWFPGSTNASKAEFDMVSAQEESKKYRILASKTFLRLRIRVWVWQYSLALVFLIVGYLSPLIDQVQELDVVNEEINGYLETLKFYMTWFGVYMSSEKKMSKGHPVIVLLVALIFEKQAQNWLHNRFNFLNHQLVEFVQLDFFVNFEAFKKKVVPEVEGETPFKLTYLPLFKDKFRKQNSCFDRMIEKIEVDQRMDTGLYPTHATEDNFQSEVQVTEKVWNVDNFTQEFIKCWRSIKDAKAKLAVQASIVTMDKTADLTTNYDVLCLGEFEQLIKNVQTSFGDKISTFLQQAQKKLVEKKVYIIRSTDTSHDGILYLTAKTCVQKALAYHSKWDTRYVPYISTNEVVSIQKRIDFKLEKHYLKNFRKEHAEAITNPTEADMKRFEVIDKAETEREMARLRDETEIIIDRKFKYQLFQGLRLVYEQFSLLLLLCSVVVKCNIISVIYLMLVIRYLNASNKSQAMVQQCKVIGACICVQYWLYLLNMTSHSAVQEFPNDPYPRAPNYQGEYKIPVFYKFSFFTENFENAYFFSMGVNPATIWNIQIDFLNLMLATLYIMYCKNPVLSRKAEFRWCYFHYDEVKGRTLAPEEKSYQDILQQRKQEGQANLNQRATERHAMKAKNYTPHSKLMKNLRRLNQIRKGIKKTGFPDMDAQVSNEEKCKDCIKNMNYTQDEREESELLRKLKTRSSYYSFVKFGTSLVYTCWHIVTIVMILFMALLRRSLLSFGYLLILFPFIRQSRQVLDQYTFYERAVLEVNEVRKKEDLAWHEFATKFGVRQQNRKNDEIQWQELKETAGLPREDIEEYERKFNALSAEAQQEYIHKVNTFLNLSDPEKLKFNKVVALKRQYWENPEENADLLDAKTIETRAKIEKQIEKSHEWVLIRAICLYLALYSFFDFLVQVIFQLPYLPEIDSLEDFGIRKIHQKVDADEFGYKYMIDNPDTYQGFVVSWNSILLQLLNCIIVTFISTQAEIFKGEGYYRFITGKYHCDPIPATQELAQTCKVCNKTSETSQLQLFMKVAKLKQDINDFDFNNEKLRKIVAIHKTQHQILQTVERIKLNVFLWRKAQQRSLIHEWHEAMRILGDDKVQIKAPLLYDNTARMTEHLETRVAEKEEQTKCLPKVEKSKDGSGNVKLSFEEKKLLIEKSEEVLRDHLPIRAGIYCWLCSFSDQFTFNTREKHMSKVRKQLEKGYRKDANELEGTVRTDLKNFLIQSRKVNSDNEIEKEGNFNGFETDKFKDIPLTKVFCEWGHIWFQNLCAIARIMITRTQFFAYIAMILSTCFNAGIVSILYPLALFGVALVEERRPKQSFWRFMLTYSLVVLVLKFIINLSFITEELNTDRLQNGTFTVMNAYFKFGLHNIPELTEVFKYMIPEVMILTYIMLHEIIERFMGMNEYDENFDAKLGEAGKKPNETVIEAIERINRCVKEMERRQTLRRPTLLFNAIGKKLVDVHLPKENLDKDGDSEQVQKESVKQPLVTVVQVEKMMAQTYETQEAVGEAPKKGFFDSEYFCRLFPRTLQQKPGGESYGLLMMVQFMLIVYLVYGYSNFAAMGPYEESFLFKSEMVLVLFIQIFIMIIERYCARTVTREKAKDENDVSSKMQFTQKELFLEPGENEYDLTVRHVVQKLKFVDLNEHGAQEALETLKDETQRQLESETRKPIAITPQQKTKFILHWTHLIVVHIFVFWYLPITSNLSLYGEPNCRADQRYGCKEFRQNFSLELFYLIYCLYFVLSAAQISQGFPSYLKSTSLVQYEDTRYLSGDLGNLGMVIFTSLPFAVEIKCLLDFVLNTTALDLWQNMQLFQYHSDLFIAKTSNESYNRKKIGAPVDDWFGKGLCGCFCLSFVLSLVIGPFFLFSSMGSTTMFNPVMGARFSLWLQVNQTTTLTSELKDASIDSMQTMPYKIWDDEAASIYNVSQALIDGNEFNQKPETKFFGPEQLQMIETATFSDTTWIASENARAAMKEYICHAFLQNQADITGLEKDFDLDLCDEYLTDLDNEKPISIGLQLVGMFDRQGPDAAKTVKGIQQRNFNTTDPADKIALGHLANTLIQDCDLPENKNRHFEVYIHEFYFQAIMLSETTDVIPVHLTEPGGNSELRKPADLILTYRCKDQWAIGSGNDMNEDAVEDTTTGSTDEIPITFFVFSQLITIGFLQGLNITTFYTGTVLLLGFQLRPVFIYVTPRAFIYDTNYPDPMLRLCEAIHLRRRMGDLEREEENYRLLVEILRSPELLKSLCGCNLKSAESEYWAPKCSDATKLHPSTEFESNYILKAS